MSAEGAQVHQSPRLSSSTGERQENERSRMTSEVVEAAHEKFKEQLLPTTVLDMVALVSAVVTTIALAPILGFSYGDLQEADKRFIKYYQINATKPCPMFECVSTSLAFGSALPASFAAFSLLSAVGTRCILAFALYLPPGPKQQLHDRLKPLVIFSITLLGVSAFLAPYGYYWAGFVILPIETADTSLWFWSGFWICCATPVLFVTLVTLYVIAKRTQ